MHTDDLHRKRENNCAEPKRVMVLLKFSLFLAFSLFLFHCISLFAFWISHILHSKFGQSFRVRLLFMIHNCFLQMLQMNFHISWRDWFKHTIHPNSLCKCIVQTHCALEKLMKSNQQLRSSCNLFSECFVVWKIQKVICNFCWVWVEINTFSTFFQQIRCSFFFCCSFVGAFLFRTWIIDALNVRTKLYGSANLAYTN